MYFKAMKYFLSFILFLFLLTASRPSLAQTNEGVDFWFGFMEHLDINQNTKVVMITSKYNTAGVIDIPKHNWSQTFAVAENSVTLIELPSFAETLGSESISNSGIHLRSNDPVSVYIHQYHQYR